MMCRNTYFDKTKEQRKETESRRVVSPLGQAGAWVFGGVHSSLHEIANMILLKLYVEFMSINSIMLHNLVCILKYIKPYILYIYKINPDVSIIKL